MNKLRQEIAEMHSRNKRVEANKSWETSGVRIGTICIITYITTSTVLFLIGVKDFYLGALIPVTGFILSTLSLPPIKKWWINKYFHKHE